MAQEQVIDQPKPVFTLLDLEHKLGNIYNEIKAVQGYNRAIQANEINYRPEDHISRLVIAAGQLHELLAIVTKTKNDLGSIEMPIETAKAITDTIQTEKPEFSVCGVQLIENGKLVGTSLYSTVIKARKIKDVLNQRFAELRVDHVAKIVNYPVF